MWLEAVPDIAITPYDQVVSLLQLRMLVDRSSHRLQNFVMRVWTRGLWVQSSRDDVRFEALHQVYDGNDVTLVRRLRCEDICGVEAQAKVGNVRQLPADVTPDTLGLKLTAGSLENLNLRLVLLARILSVEVRPQLLHPLQQGCPVSFSDILEDVAHVVDETPSSTFIAKFIVCCGNTIEELPDITDTKVTILVCAGHRVVACCAETLVRSRFHKLLDTVEQHEHMPIGHGVEATSATDKMMLVGFFTCITKNTRQIAKHDVVVVRLGMQELCILLCLHAFFNLCNQRVLDHVCKICQGLCRATHNNRGAWITCYILVGEIHQALAKPY
mmetsp:Transcript_106961/g.185850  ORF Transcript_106961/g.185850 Transcript_106961/m.185850 type:complete len:329 (+) Transcript_106961:372-1358(+)